jgi:hypothetical protein
MIAIALRCRKAHLLSQKESVYLVPLESARLMEAACDVVAPDAPLLLETV